MASLDPAAAGTELREPRAAGALGTVVVGLILPVGLALGWEVLATLGVVSTRLLPPPSQILKTLGDLATRGVLLDHILVTLWRVWWGFLLGAAAGTVLGAATGVWPLARRLLDPTIQALRSIPSIAWVPLFILWFGIFETPKVLLIAVGVFFPVYLTLAGAIASVDRKLVEVGRIYRFNTWDLVRRILLPAALPTYITGLRGGLGLGWMFVVAAEFMGASKGLGYLLVDGQMTGRPATILAAILLFAVLGKLTDMALAAIGARLLRWQDGFRPEGA
ncbi:ABC transporter permease [Inquilinus sp.]|jgi:sulfonate transport system permease protein|uniref:ABC transporter permease n=1 Tax=Inquilinus sp. TaxID=1932117 RepID=UPI003785091D